MAAAAAAAVAEAAHAPALRPHRRQRLPDKLADEQQELVEAQVVDTHPLTAHGAHKGVVVGESDLHEDGQGCGLVFVSPREGPGHSPVHLM